MTPQVWRNDIRDPWKKVEEIYKNGPWNYKTYKKWSLKCIFEEITCQDPQVFKNDKNRPLD